MTTHFKIDREKIIIADGRGPKAMFTVVLHRKYGWLDANNAVVAAVVACSPEDAVRTAQARLVVDTGQFTRHATPSRWQHNVF